MSNDTAIISLKEKIDNLNQQAWEVRVSDMPKAFELSQESVKLARSINYPKGLAEGLRLLGFSYLRFSKNDEAALLLKESLSLFQSLNDLSGQAIVYEYLGIIERNRGNLGTSLELLLKGNGLIQQTYPPEIELTSCYQIGVTYKHLGNHENALDYLYKTLSLAKKINYPLMEAYATNIIGSIYFDNGNYDQALDCYQQGLPIRRQSNDKWGEAGSLDNIGFTYLKLNDLDKAIDYCKQSLAICQATGDKKGEANALLHLGEIYKQAGDIKQAADFSNKSLEIRKERGDKRGETEVLLFLAGLYKNRNDVEDHQIFEWLSNALKIADEVKAQDLLSKTYYDLHEYYQQKGNFKESLVQLEAHFQIEKELHKNSINQKIANLEISHKAEVISQRNKELTELNEKIEKANEELKIEAALERVRSASIAMHSSDELHKVIRVLTDQLSVLGFHFHTANFITNESMPDWEIWISSPGLNDTPPRIHVPYLDHFLFNERNNAITTGKEFLTASLNKMEKDKFFHYLFEETAAKVTPTERKEWVYQQKGMGLTTVLMKNISLSVINYDGRLYTTEENEVIKRLATVFEQSYTRFLDLQKAEEQARESQVQLAMERVRARTMAMQHSDELKDAASLLFKQLEGLGIKSWSSGFNIWETDSRSAIINMCNPDGSIATPYHLPHTEEIFFIRIDEARQRGDEFLVMETGGKDLEQTYNYMFSLPEVKKMLGGMEDTGFQIPKFQVSHCAFFSHGYLMFITYEPVPEMWDVFKRFAKVFEQTYTRFLDLQKAEAQARESQIQLALERVRARTMAMQRSDELRETVLVIYEQLQQLNFDSKACNIIIIDKESGIAQYWVSGFSQEIFPENYTVPYLDHPYQDALLNPWKQGDKYVVYEYTGQLKQSFDEIFFTQTEFRNIPEEAKKVMIGLKSVKLSTAFISYGALQVIGAEPLSEEKANILKRFAKVFEQTYTRFLDLQKAEAQARESQIEAALERVRSRTMGMQKSDELKEVIQVVYEQFVHLNINIEHTGFVMDYKARDDYDIWIADKLEVPSHLTIPYFDSVYYNRFNEAKKNGEDFFATNLDFEEKNRFYQKIIEYVPGLPEETKEFLFSIPGLAGSTVLLENIGLYIENFSGIPFSDDENNTLMRFGKVFQQTYTRFLDLKKAEAQAREAQIENALEKVRSRTMAMQKSEDLNKTASDMFKQIQVLGMQPWACGFNIFDRDEKTVTQYMSLADGGISPPFRTPLTEDPFFISIYNARQRKDELLVMESGGKSLAETYHYMFSLPGSGEIFGDLENSGFEMPKFQITHCAYFSQGYLVFITYEPVQEAHEIFKRFARVFEQTYTRFLDLKKAEAQAREAHIEAALEKVRSRSLAMQKAEELQEVVSVVAEKLKELGVILDANGVIICTYFPDSKDVMHWMAAPDFSSSGSFLLPYFDHPIFNDAWESKIRGDEYFSKSFPKEQKDSFFQYAFEHSDYRHFPDEFKQWIFQNDKHSLSFAWAKNSALLIPSHTGIVPSEKDQEILKRFAKVFEQAYIRFLDLQKAEAQAREAQIEAALEKVRSRTLAMQKSDELAETAAEVFRQLIALGIEPNRLYIGIVKEETGDMEMWATDEDGTQVGKRFMFNKNENASVLKLYDGWKTQKRSVIVDMQGKELEDYFHYLNNVMHIPFKGGLTQKRRVQSVAYFSKGFIGMASPDGQGDETIQLLERFAAVFNLTFTRFNDLKIAEAHAVQAKEDLVKLQTEKKRAEDALSELQVTQKQLIQSEKMASLGELTAGIAHEIQNPLNFVNNFSDVNKELLAEMKEEIEKGNTDEVIAIANDIISNEEKINHHGKRADAIVKGMLQHSRSSSGVKEPTDINELADEYLRLAYHGLRAKDKSFNATMKTDFDEKIGKVNVIPQEIGRVFLNLITNAFYVVAEKKKQLANGYEPTVTITTKKENDKIVVSVKDNGSGIPQKDLDKIFQPFFTTKPTGQGTGLGLSLSYDIVKAHSGEIKVKTKDGEGSEFVIQLPVV